jgi:hypothetical protein
MQADHIFARTPSSYVTFQGTKVGGFRRISQKRHVQITSSEATLVPGLCHQLI